MESKKINKLFIDTKLFAISSFGSKIILFLLTPLYTSILSTTEYGIADIINTTINFIYPILTLAISDATLRFSMDKNKSKKYVISNALILIFLSIIILLIISPLIINHNDIIQEYWIFFILTYSFFNIHNCFSYFIRGLGKTRLFAVQSILQTVCIVTSNLVFLLLFNFGLKGYLISLLFGYGIPILLMFFKGKIYKFCFPFEFDLKLLKEMLRYSIPMVPTILGWAINLSIDRYMIISVLGYGESGIYSIAHKIPTIFTAILTIFINAWQLSTIENFGTKNESSFHSVIYKYVNLFGILGCMIILIVNKKLSSFLFADEYYIAWKYVPMLTLSTFYSSLSGFIASSFRAAKKTENLFFSVLIGAVVNIFLNFNLIPILGVLGAGIATAVSFFLIWIIRFIMVQNIIKININIIRTIITYSIFIFSAVFVSFSNIYRISILYLFIVIIIIVNWTDLVNLVISLTKILNKKILKNK